MSYAVTTLLVQTATQTLGHWSNSEASHSLTALIQCNHHLVVLQYLKLPSELCRYYCAQTDNRSPSRHYPRGTTECCINLLLSMFPRELAVLPWRLQDFPLKQRPTPFLCLNHTVFDISTISKKLYLNLSKYVDKLLVVKTLININHFGWTYETLRLKILNILTENILHFS